MTSFLLHAVCRFYFFKTAIGNFHYLNTGFDFLNTDSGLFEIHLCKMQTAMYRCVQLFIYPCDIQK